MKTFFYTSILRVFSGCSSKSFLKFCITKWQNVVYCWQILEKRMHYGKRRMHCWLSEEGTQYEGKKKWNHFDGEFKVKKDNKPPMEKKPFKMYSYFFFILHFGIPVNKNTTSNCKSASEMQKRANKRVEKMFPTHYFTFYIFNNFYFVIFIK